MDTSLPRASLHQTNIIAPGEGEPAPNFKDQRRRAVQHESKQPVRIIIIISNYATQHLTMLNQSEGRHFVFNINFQMSSFKIDLTPHLTGLVCKALWLSE